MKAMRDEMARAAELLRLAATYIRDNADTGNEIYYDGTLCDGSCLADDCETQAEMIEASIAGNRPAPYRRFGDE